jgi:hypothetical protein
MRLQEFIDVAFPILKLDPTDGQLWVEGAYAIHERSTGAEVPLHTLFFPAMCLLMMGMANKPMSTEKVENIIYWEHPYPFIIKYEDGIQEIHSLSRVILSSLELEGTVSLEKIYGILVNIARIAALEGQSLSSLALEVAKRLAGAQRLFQVIPNYNKDEDNEEGDIPPTQA